jgi:hypothetical protein
MGLSPGPYSGPRSIEASVNLAESTFYFLEGSIANNHSKYSGYAHWGVTSIPSEDWFKILGDWQVLREKLDASENGEVFHHLSFFDDDARNDFLSNADSNRLALIRTIDDLSDWLRTQLEEHSVVTVLGI